MCANWSEGGKSRAVKQSSHSAQVDQQQRGYQEAVDATAEAEAGYYFTGCMIIHHTCYNSASKREKALTFSSVLKRRNVNLAYRNKGKC